VTSDIRRPNRLFLGVVEWHDKNGEKTLKKVNTTIKIKKKISPIFLNIEIILLC
jgi:hypothetical protein